MRALAAEGEMRALLERRGVRLVEVDRAHAFVGRGEDAQAAWDAFKAVAAMPAYEPFTDRYGATCHVDVTHDGDMLLFETSIGRQRTVEGNLSGGQPAAPTVFIADFTRQFSFEDPTGEYLGMNGLTLTVAFPLSPDLERLGAVQTWGCGGPPWTEAEWRRRGEEPGTFAAALEWIDEVERSQAFTAASARPSMHFGFGQSDY